MTDMDGRTLLGLAIQVTGTVTEVANTVWQSTDRLPWAKRPSLPAPESHEHYGVVNIEGKITEVAEPSGFAKFLGTFLGSQKAAIETYVKDRITQSLDQSAAAEAQLRALDAAGKARQSYEAAHKDGSDARKALDQAPDTQKSQARQVLELR